MSTFDDIRALGAGAPLRAVYEASKRFGGHAVVFGSIARSEAGGLGSSPFSFGTVPSPIRDETLAAADRICSGEIAIFDRVVHVGDAPGWHRVIDGDGDWPVIDWWKIDIRSDERIGDVKWAWELGRHRHLVILARAVHLNPGADRYRTVLNRHLRSWLDASPPEKGVHWYSNLEIALRAINWLQILALADDHLDADVEEGMWRHLWHSGKHLVADLPYTVSTMQNNHLLGDALGLITLGMAFEGPTAERWRTRGERVFSAQLERQTRPDGSMIEDSVSYHRFVLEMLAMRVVIGEAPAEVVEAMERSAQFLARLGVLEGPVLQYGDWDEGRVIASTGDPTNLAGSVRLALALAGSGAPDAWRQTSDEVAWYTSQGVPIDPDRPETSGNDLGGGIARTESGSYTVWLKAGGGPSHGHADLSSVAIAHDAEWLVGDPGTGTYNGDIGLRTRLRSSESHSVARVDGEDQLVAHRVFRWKYTAEGHVGEPIHLGDSTLMWCVHDAYLRLDPPRRTVRIVAVDASGVEVIDVVEGDAAVLVTSVPLGPDGRWNPDTSAITLGDEQWMLSTRDEGDGISLEAGEWSRTYGTVEASERLEVTHRGPAPSQWSIRETGADRRVWLSGLRVTFTNDGVTLSVSTSDGREERSVGLGR